MKFSVIKKRHFFSVEFFSHKKHSLFSLSVNFSTQQMRDSGFVEFFSHSRMPGHICNVFFSPRPMHGCVYSVFFSPRSMPDNVLSENFSPGKTPATCAMSFFQSERARAFDVQLTLIHLSDFELQFQSIRSPLCFFPFTVGVFSNIFQKNL